MFLYVHKYDFTENFFCAGKRQTRLFFLSPDTTIFHYQIVSKSVILLTNQKKGECY